MCDFGRICFDDDSYLIEIGSLFNLMDFMFVFVVGLIVVFVGLGGNFVVW